MHQQLPDFEGFDWDKGNRNKNWAKHQAADWECEQIFFNEPLLILDDPKHSIAEERFAAFGKTFAGRRLVAVFTKRGRLVRVISARDMNKRERKFYEETAEKHPLL